MKNNPPSFCHPDKKSFAKGLCYKCWAAQRKNNPHTKMALCHPDRVHKAHGMCHHCYENSGRRKNNKAKATCHPERPHQANGLCKPCYNKEYRKTYKRSPAVAARRIESGWKSRGVKFTVDEYNQLLKKQRGECAVCHSIPKSKKLVVDHDYATGMVRGLLCDFCNRRLLIRRNTVEIFRAAVDYIESFQDRMSQNLKIV